MKKAIRIHTTKYAGLKAHCALLSVTLTDGVELALREGMAKGDPGPLRIPDVAPKNIRISAEAHTALKAFSKTYRVSMEEATAKFIEDYEQK